MAKNKKRPLRRKTGRAASQQSAAATRLKTLALYRERKQLHQQIKKDRSQRFTKFLAQVHKPTEPPSLDFALRAVAPLPGKESLRILAEGDSWFEYPLPVNSLLFLLRRSAVV